MVLIARAEGFCAEYTRREDYRFDVERGDFRAEAFDHTWLLLSCMYVECLVGGEGWVCLRERICLLRRR